MYDDRDLDIYRVFFWADEINAVYVTLCCCDSCRYRQGALPNHPDS